MTAVVGVDIGGTFTDVVLLTETGRLVHTKVPSTSGDLVRGVRQGVEKVLAIGNVSPAEVDRVVHGSTVATNAFLERKGSLTGVLTTAGFEDVLEIGRTQRTDLYGLVLEPVAPVFLSRRRHRHGINERVAADGSVVASLDVPGVRDSVRALVAGGVEAVAVCYLFSFLNPEHELRTRELVLEEAPHLHVSLSCEIDPQFREYERTLMTTLDAYLRGAVETYVTRLTGMIDDLAVAGPLQIMQSRGGIQTAAAAASHPGSMLASGLAAGVLGARFAAETAGFTNVITLDIGGTSCDVALVADGKPFVAGRATIGGYPLRMQLVDVNTIGAGGGSIAWIDEGGGLRVGPKSAGAEPGPAAYGRGGVDATVTDASVVLGYLNPVRFADGELTLDVDAATAALERLAGPLGLSVPAVAAGIHTILNTRMAEEIRVVSVQRGYDPRQFGLVALGGGGPVHAVALGIELGLPYVVVPRTPGVLSAFGLLVADVEFEQVSSLAGAPVDDERIDATLAALNAAGIEQMLEDGADLDEVIVHRFAEMRYARQSYELSVPLQSGAGILASAEAAFHDLHERLYGHADRTGAVDVVAVRTIHVSPKRPPVLEPPATLGSVLDARVDELPAYFPGVDDFVPTPRYDRSRLPVGAALSGPAIVEQPDTTVVVHPGQQVSVHPSGALVIMREAS